MASSDVVDATRARLGPVGVWLATLMRCSADEERAAARSIEELGYGSIWTGEAIGGKEAFAHQGLLLAATEQIVTGSGIANVWARHPAAMQGGANTLGAAYPGRFILGIGISHALSAERSGQRYEKPLAQMSRYIDDMDGALADAPRTEVPVVRVLAALRSGMLALSRDKADGAHPYFTPVSHTPRAREILGPDKLLIPEQAVVLESEPSEARRIARTHLTNLLRSPNYLNNLRWLGYGEDDTAGSGSDRLVDAIVAWGSEEDIARRVQEHLDGGADHVLLQPLGELEHAVRQLERLAPVVLS